MIERDVTAHELRDAPAFVVKCRETWRYSFDPHLLGALSLMWFSVSFQSCKDLVIIPGPMKLRYERYKNGPLQTKQILAN